MTGFYGSDNYCTDCDKPYKNTIDHFCPSKCKICYSSECVPGESIRCDSCDRLCRSDDCYERHRAKIGNQRFSVCDQIYQCRICCKIIKRRDCPKGTHICYTVKCPSCQKFVNLSEHRCYLNVKPSASLSENLIFF